MKRPFHFTTGAWISFLIPITGLLLLLAVPIITVVANTQLAADVLTAVYAGPPGYWGLVGLIVILHAIVLVFCKQRNILVHLIVALLTAFCALMVWIVAIIILGLSMGP